MSVVLIPCRRSKSQARNEPLLKILWRDSALNYICQSLAITSGDTTIFNNALARFRERHQTKSMFISMLNRSVHPIIRTFGVPSVGGVVNVSVNSVTVTGTGRHKIGLPEWPRSREPTQSSSRVRYYTGSARPAGACDSILRLI